ncbi:glycoside hydrolase domain-containing protein [Kitasatospora sp. NPDC002227]|uniref:glycoside hydrolase domain-containing protein n=1 Tax=Kitasatospora sp. NPDC002227 TaxID=3154773 RepID=UPI00332240A6
MQLRLTSQATALVLAATGLLTAAPAVAAAPSPTGQQVTYRGYHLRVPDGWQVVDLAKAPTTCVRQDRNTVYLGTPGEQQDCPSHLVAEKADSLLVTPERSGDTPVTELAPGAPVPAAVVAAGAADHEFTVGIAGTGLRVTAGYQGDADRVRAILDGARADSSASPGPGAARPKSLRPQMKGPAPSTEATGLGFDACTAPSANTMKAWAASPYRTIGIYVGGPARACAQPNLTPTWVADRAAEGWSFLPIYVGSQGNTRFKTQIPADETKARQQGTKEAAEAVRQAKALGFGPRTVVYNDMENYAPAARARVLAYLAGWTTEVRRLGHRSGVYSSASSGVAHLAARHGDANYPSPDVIWSASWSTAPDTSDQGMVLPGPQYWPTSRVHQFQQNVTETYGNASIQIDRNAVAVPAPGSLLTPERKLMPGQSLNSTNATLVMQGDGNLVLYPKTRSSAPGGPLWASGTAGHPGAYAVMQPDGNLVVYRKGSGSPRDALWSTRTWNQPGGHAVLQDDGNFVLYRGGSPLWSSNTYGAGATLGPGTMFTPGRWTQSATTWLVMQHDGNLVLYRKRDGAPLWASGTYGNPGAYAVMQPDGNLVVYRKGGNASAGGALWASGTFWSPGAYAAVQDDANLVVYRRGGASPTGAIWASGTWNKG